MQMGKISCIEFVPQGVATVTSVKLQADIGQYSYQHIGTKGKNRCDTTDEDICQNVKFAAIELDYFVTQGIPVDNVNSHSLRSGGAMALALSRYYDTHIHKMGRWKGTSFKEYIHEYLA